MLGRARAAQITSCVRLSRKRKTDACRLAKWGRSIGSMSELRLTGLKRGSGSLSWDEIAAMPATEMTSIADNAIGDAVPAALLIELAEPEQDAAYCSVVSVDGAYSASIPIADLVEGGWLAFRLDGAPLPAGNGGPLRLTVALGRTLCWNVKDVGELRFTPTKEPDSVPARPEH